MRKYLAIIGLITAVVVTPLLAVGVAHAANFRSGNSATLAKGETVDSTLFIAGQTVEVAGEVNGDLYCAGSSVTVTGTVHGDVMCAGQTVDVRGIVDGDVRVAGETVKVEASVVGNISAAGQTVTIGSDARARDVHAAGNFVVMNGTVQRDIDVAGTTVDVNGTVGRNAIAAGETVSLGSSAKIAGNLEYHSRQDLSKASGATIAGTTRHEIPKGEEKSKKDFMGGVFSSFKWFFAITTLVTSLVLAALLPRWFYSVSERGVEQPLLSAVTGIGVGVGSFILAMILLFTFIGVPLAILFTLLSLVIWMVSVPAFSFYVGRLLFRNTTNNLFYYMLAGSVIVFVLFLIPVLGGIVFLVASWFGSGMIILELVRHWSKPQYRLSASRKRA